MLILVLDSLFVKCFHFLSIFKLLFIIIPSLLASILTLIVSKIRHHCSLKYTLFSTPLCNQRHPVDFPIANVPKFVLVILILLRLILLQNFLFLVLWFSVCSIHLLVVRIALGFLFLFFLFYLLCSLLLCLKDHSIKSFCHLLLNDLF